MKKFHWFLCVAKNCDWSRKTTPRVGPPGMKTYSESRTELRNIQIFKKMLGKSSQFLSSEQPCEPKIFFFFFYYCYYYNTCKTYIHLLTLTVTYFQCHSLFTGFFFLLKTKKKKQLRNYCFY